MHLSYSFLSPLWLSSISLTLGIITSGLTTSSVQAKTLVSPTESQEIVDANSWECGESCQDLAQTVPSQIPNPNLVNELQPRDTTPEEIPRPNPPKEPLPPTPENLLELPNFTIEPGQSIPGSLIVERFEIEGNTVFTPERLAEEVPLCIFEELPEEIQVCPSEENQISQQKISLLEVTNQSISFNQLTRITSEIADFYKQQGYETTGTNIEIPENLQQGQPVVLVIKVIEGKLETIEVTEIEGERNSSPTRRQELMRNYVRSRLHVEESETSQCCPVKRIPLAVIPRPFNCWYISPTI